MAAKTNSSSSLNAEVKRRSAELKKLGLDSWIGITVQMGYDEKKFANCYFPGRHHQLVFQLEREEL